VAGGAVHGAAGDAAAETTRQLVSGERLDVGRIAMAGVQGAAIGGGLAAASPVARAALGRVRRADGTPGGTPGVTQGAHTPVNTRAAQAARTRNAGPGFQTQRAAARAALTDANPRSVRANREFGGVIYRNPAAGRYHYTTPQRGSATGFTPNPGARPAGTTLVGDYHTHGDYSVGTSAHPVRTSSAAHDAFNSDRFSTGPGGDIAGITADAAGHPGYRGYLGTPSGRFLEHDPVAGTTRTINR
jgi:hypothetical protein